MNVQEIINKVPNYESFFTVDEMNESTFELAKKFPETVSVFEVGKSRNQEPIQCIKIGNGSKNALLFACPHPSEPIGVMTLEFFTQELAKNKKLREDLDFTWYLIKCIDPDGARLGEKWYKGPYNLYNYIKNYYRPADYEQVEFTFPFNYKEIDFDKPMPETQVLMNIIDDIKPEFMYSLHNTDFSGAFWYMSHDIPELYDSLYEAAKKQGMPLALGEPEAPFVKEFAPAVYKMPFAREIYDFMEKHTGSTPKYEAGTTSADYALTKANCVTLVTELPHFFDKRIADMGKGDMTRKEVLLKNIEESIVYYNMIEDLLREIRSYISKSNPFVKLVNQMLEAKDDDNEAKKDWIRNNKEFEELATVSQIFDNKLLPVFHYGLFLSLTVRTCEFELERLDHDNHQDKSAINKIREIHRQGSEKLIILCQEMENTFDYSVIPVQKLVKIQIESGLKVAYHITNNKILA